MLRATKDADKMEEGKGVRVRRRGTVKGAGRCPGCGLDLWLGCRMKEGKSRRWGRRGRNDRKRCSCAGKRSSSQAG